MNSDEVEILCRVIGCDREVLTIIVASMSVRQRREFIRQCKEEDARERERKVG